MPTTAGEQQRLTLAAAALLASALTIVALRSISSSRSLVAAAVPNADLESLTPYVRPLRDSSGLARAGSSAMVITRDPFATTGVARSGVSSTTTVNAPLPTTENGQQWVVSTILFEGSKKSAIVNNAWVTIGDTLGGGSRLTAVERDHIVVTDAKGIRHNVPIQGGESW